MKNLVVSDYDQTFNVFGLGLKYNISRVNKFMKNGNIFAISTGRNYQNIAKEVDKYNIKYDYISCCDGGEIYNNKGNLVYSAPLAHEELSFIKDIVSKYPNAKILNSHFMYGKIKDVDPLVCIITLNGIKGFFETSETKDIVSDITLNSNLKCNVYVGNIFVTNREISKGHSVEFLRDGFGISKANTFTIGDYKNDYDMIKDYNGFSMPWAMKKIKDVSCGTYFAMGKLPEDILKEKNSFVRKLKYK